MRPRAKTVPWLRDGHDLAVALNPVPGDLRRLADPDGTLEWVLRNADGSRTVAALTSVPDAPEPKAITAALAMLDQAALVADADATALMGGEQREQWRNNLEFFDAYATLEIGVDVYHQRLRESRVLLLGAGGLGSVMLMNLVGLGVGEVVVVDDDVVETANFSRQFTYRTADIGRPKALRAAQWARAFSARTTVTPLIRRIESEADVTELLDGIDLVVSAIDQPAEAPMWVNAACHAARVPSLYGGFFFSKGRYESVWPEHSGCLACLVLGERFALEPINRATGPSVSIVGGLMALEAVRYLTRYAPPAAAARSWIVDFATGEVSEAVRWGRSPHCPVCSDQPALVEQESQQSTDDGRGGYAPSDQIDVAHLTVQPDGGEFLLGDLASGTFVAIPQVGVVVLDSLRDGETIAQATTRATAFAETDVNVLEFVDALREQGLLGAPIAAIAAAGAQVTHRTDLEAAESAAAPGRIGRLGSRIADAAAHTLLSPVALSLAALSLVGALIVMWLVPGLRPSWESIIFLPDPALSILVNIVTVVVLACMHEASHWLGARRLGLPATFSVSRRGLFLVFETDLTRLWAVPRNSRYVAFLAGSAFDSAVLGASVFARLAHQQGWVTLPEILNRFLAIVVLTQVIALIGQTPVFMRTDLYAVLVSALGCRNLYQTSMLSMKRHFVRLSAAEQSELDNASERDLQVARWFGALYLIGVVGLTYLLLGVFVPAAFSMIVWSVQNVATTAITSVTFWEALLVALFLSAEILWPPVHWAFGRLRRPRSARALIPAGA